MIPINICNKHATHLRALQKHITSIGGGGASGEGEDKEEDRGTVLDTLRISHYCEAEDKEKEDFRRCMRGAGRQRKWGKKSCSVRLDGSVGVLHVYESCLSSIMSHVSSTGVLHVYACSWSAPCFIERTLPCPHTHNGLLRGDGSKQHLDESCLLYEPYRSHLSYMRTSLI